MSSNFRQNRIRPWAVQMIACAALSAGVFALSPRTWSDESVKSSCLLVEEGLCVLGALYPEIRLAQHIDGAMTIQLWSRATESSRAPAPSTAIVSLQEDLAKRIDTAELTSSDASWIEGELTDAYGVRYSIPSVEELKESLGFPAETTFEAEDYRDLVVVHMQVSLGISPLSAEYLSERMGMHSVTLPERPQDTEELPSSAPAAPSEPSATREESATPTMPSPAVTSPPAGTGESSETPPSAAPALPSAPPVEPSEPAAPIQFSIDQPVVIASRN